MQKEIRHCKFCGRKCEPTRDETEGVFLFSTGELICARCWFKKLWNEENAQQMAAAMDKIKEITNE